MGSLQEEALRSIEEIFGDRVKCGPAGGTGALASVMPWSADEIESLARLAERFSLPLVARGAGMASEPGVERGGILVLFDLMRRVRLPDDETWVEAEPGVPWLELDDDLRARGRGLTVYPTSAPRATVGGWLATDGLGVGSFEYGRLRENVISVGVVLAGGKRREVGGEELGALVGTDGTSGIVVGARLRTRRAGSDVPFGLVLADPGALVRCLAGLIEDGVPLWHLAFLNPRMSRARGLDAGYLLFGAYPEERSAEVEEGLRGVGSAAGRALSAAEAHRVWGERFFPVAPSRPTPSAGHRLVDLTEVEGTLEGLESLAAQGTVARSREALFLIFDPRAET